MANIPIKYGSGFVDWRRVFGRTTMIDQDTDTVMMPDGIRITRTDFEQMSKTARESLVAQGGRVEAFGNRLLTVGGGGGAGGEGVMPNDLDSLSDYELGKMSDIEYERLKRKLAADIERRNKEAAAAKPEPEPAPLEMPKLKFPELDI